MIGVSFKYENKPGKEEEESIFIKFAAVWPKKK